MKSRVIMSSDLANSFKMLVKGQRIRIKRERDQDTKSC